MNFYGMISDSDICDILRTLMEEQNDFMNFAKIILIFCGLQKKIYMNCEFQTIFSKFVENSEKSIQRFQSREKYAGEAAVIELKKLASENFETNIY
jgi:hypothetical protein